MGYRCRWQQIGRNDHTEPPAITKEQLSKINNVYVLPYRKTIHRVVSAGGDTLGYVRTSMNGQSYKLSKSDEWTLAASNWNATDPPHAIAILWHPSQGA